MSANHYFQLLNPLVFLLIAAGLFCVYRTRPSKAVLYLFASYVFGATAFLSDILVEAYPPFLGEIEIVTLYAIAAVVFSGGLVLRYRERAPWRILWSLGAVHVAAYAWFHISIGEDFWWRTFQANFGCGLIFLTGLAMLRGRQRNRLDRLIFWLAVIGAAQCFLRPIAVTQVIGGFDALKDYNAYTSILALHFVVGACAFMLGMALLVSCSVEIVEELQRESVTDPLSGVLNRRGFEAAAADGRLLHCGRAAVIIADIDHFKSVNDTFGHAFGDQVIAELGALFAEYCDAERRAGRLGGEEFAMVLPGETLEDARALAEALRDDFEKLLIESEGGDASFTASFGVAFGGERESLFEILGRADDALYLSKANGRNRVTCQAELAAYRLKRSHRQLERRRNRDPQREAKAG